MFKTDFKYARRFWNQISKTGFYIEDKKGVASCMRERIEEALESGVLRIPLLLQASITNYEIYRASAYRFKATGLGYEVGRIKYDRKNKEIRIPIRRR